MLEAGILHDGDPLELIDGILVHKDRGGDGMTYGRRHARVVSLLTDCKPRIEALGCYLRVQQPIELTATSAPEPDISIVEGNARSYTRRNPGPADVLAVIEVADSSLAFDRGPKLRLYASAGIRSYVIVDIPGARIEVHQDPDPARGCYVRRNDAGPAETHFSPSIRYRSDSLRITL